MFNLKVIRLLWLSAALALVGCGQKGPLEPVEPAPQNQPQEQEPSA